MCRTHTLQVSQHSFSQETHHDRDSFLGAIGVWHNAALVARVRPVYNDATGDLEPLLEMLP